ncbi:hypothetical protein B0F88_107110 [Methylobacter tundripaludum]|uniref:Uncharacterized protein n=1 Tax=Methylobacter tundripaludum TaxID=173365 RepID=A0A2S6H2E9_9GAMM|nr:hypothetical protein B0F88_107110 [Methylobacter tundripaludum]
MGERFGNVGGTIDILTAIANDCGYDLVFPRQLIGKATAKDVS